MPAALIFISLLAFIFGILWLLFQYWYLFAGLIAIAILIALFNR